MADGRTLAGLILGAALASPGCSTPPAGTAAPAGAIEPDWADRRALLVDHLRAGGIHDERVLTALARVPRHLFVPDDLRPSAYDDRALPIGLGQTISQPFIVAYMSEALALDSSHRVLEIGTGSGYQAAVLAELAAEVYSIEIVGTLADRARTSLQARGYANIEVRHGDGHAGWPEQAPFDRIIVTAAAEVVPPALVEQLAVGGRLIAPVGVGQQVLTVVDKTAGGVIERRTLPVLFVPMTNEIRR